jgi:hypothetical protein
MFFEPKEEYKVLDPANILLRQAELHRKHETKPRAKRGYSWIKYFPPGTTPIPSTRPGILRPNSDIRKIKSIYQCKAMPLTAKSGYTFDESAVNSGEFSVIINDKLDISYTAELIKSGTEETLKITFDEAYPQSEIKKIAFNYGTK